MQQAHDLSPRDELTGLPSRQALGDGLDAALERVRRDDGRLAVICLDLDRFKLVNDTLGHAAGDRLLREFASRLRAAVCPDDLVARLGGDEFVVVHNRVRRPGHVEALCARITTAAALPFDLDASTTHIGVVDAPLAGGDRPELLRKANIALNEAKGSGRGCMRMFDQGMETRVRFRGSVERDLRAALADPAGGGLRLAWQPLVRTATRQPVGAEALLHWTYTEQGLIPPGDFIPVAEEAGLISERLGAGRGLPRGASKAGAHDRSQPVTVLVP